jgi:hypothetical protein
MSRGTLQEAINRERDGQPLERWEVTRKLIALSGIAAGLNVLHAKSGSRK